MAALILTVLVLTPGVSLAGQTTTLNLTEALNYARTHYPEIRAAEFQLAAQDAAIQSTEAALLPQIDANVVYSEGMSNSTAGLGLTGIANSAFRKGYGASVNLEQNLYDFGRTRDRVGAEQARRKEIEARWNLTIAEVLKNVADRYLECQKSKRYREIYANARNNLEPLRKEIQGFVNTGQRSEVDLALTDMRVDEAAAHQITAEHFESIAIERLNLALGNAGHMRFSCGKESALAIPSKRSLEAMTRAAKDLRPELQTLRAAQTRAAYEKLAAQDEYLPELVGIASAGRLQDTNVVKDRNFAVGVALKIPLFDGFRTQAGVKKAEAESSQLSQEAELENQRIASEVRQALEERRRTAELAGITSKRRDKAASTLALARERYSNKGGILSDWDQAYRAWLLSEFDYWNLDAEKKSAIIGLYYATGTLEDASDGHHRP